MGVWLCADMKQNVSTAFRSWDIGDAGRHGEAFARSMRGMEPVALVRVFAVGFRDAGCTGGNAPLVRGEMFLSMRLTVKIIFSI